MRERDETASNEYFIRRPKAGDREGIRRLFDLTLDSDRASGFWEWKHVDNPFGESYWLVADVDGEIVGARAFMQWRWRSGTEPRRAVRAVDTATHPEWRRRGIFTNLTMQLVDDVRDDGVDFVFNTPNEYSRPGYLKMGWEVVESVPIWVKVLRPLRVARRVAPLVDVSTSASVTFETSNVDELLEAAPVEALAESCFDGESRLHTDRSREFLRWRYLEIPGIDYRARWTGDGDTGAFAVYRRRERGGLVEVMLSELVATQGLDGMRALREVVGEIAEEVEADYVIGCAARNSIEMWALMSKGFVLAPKVGPTLVSRQLSGAVPDERLHRWSAWRCGIGELEIF